MLRVALQFIVIQACVVLLAIGVWAQARPKPVFLSYEQRVVLSYLLAGAGETQEKQLEIAERFEKTVQRYIAKPVEVIHVANFQEFLKAYQGPWPGSYSLKSDLDLLEKAEVRGVVRFQAQSKALQQQIEGFILRQQQDLASMAKPLFQEIASVKGSTTPSLAESVALTKGADILSRLASNKASDRTWKQAWVLTGFGKASDLLDQQLRFIQQTGQEVAMSGKMGQQNDMIMKFLSFAFQEYFGRLSLDTKKQIISQVMGQNLNLDMEKKFELMVLSAGPQFQKLLQIVAREAGLSPELLKLFKRLESKAPAIPAAIVKVLFENERARYQWVDYKLEPLGTGTMAQVHKGQIMTPQGVQDVVIRFLKPEIEVRVREDYRILMEMAPILDNDPSFKKMGFAKMEPMIKDLNQTVMDEFNLQDTMARQQKAKEVYPRFDLLKFQGYKNYVQVQVPAMFPSDKDSKLMVQELVVGDKLDKVVEQYKELIPDFKKVIVEKMAEIWLDEVLFRSGFFHSDLHQGNFMVNFTEPRIELTILDYGMGGTISKKMQTDFLMIGSAIELGRADLLAETYWSLSDTDKNEVSKEVLTRKISEKMALILSGKIPWESIDKWTAWTVNLGVRYPYEFVSLNRGIVILDRLLVDAGSSKSMTSIARQGAVRNARSVFAEVRARKSLSFTELVRLGFFPNPLSDAAKKAKLGGGLSAPSPLVLQKAKVRCQSIYTSSRAAFSLESLGLDF